MILIQIALLLGVMLYKIFDLRYITNDSNLRCYIGDLNDILVISWQFLAVYLVFFGCFFVFFAISGYIQGNFLPISSNLKVNYIESTIIYQAVLFS